MMSKIKVKGGENTITLNDLISSCLLGTGEIRITNNKTYFVADFHTTTQSYVDFICKYVKKYDEGPSSVISKNKIKVDIEEGIYLSSWYDGPTKIFHRNPKRYNLTLKQIIMWINLYGERVSDGIIVETSIHPKYWPNLIYILEQHLNVPIISTTKNRLKILNVTDLYPLVYRDTPIIHSSKFITYLTRKEVVMLKDRRPT